MAMLGDPEATMSLLSAGLVVQTLQNANALASNVFASTLLHSSSDRDFQSVMNFGRNLW